MNVAIIPARGGSTRIPRKNLRPFYGKPIIRYSIECAKASGLFEAIYVSTDDPMIGIIAHHAGARPVMRPAELARDHIGTQEVARSVLLALPEARYACCIYATAPLMSVEDLARGFNAITAGGIDFAYAVGPYGRQAGQFYWGTREAFLEREPLEGEGARVARVFVAPKRVCDINVEEDWLRAEEMYMRLTR